YEIDYLTFGGIYREVSLRIVPATFIENIFAKTRDMLSGKPGLDVECFLQASESSRAPLSLQAELLDGDHIVSKAAQRVLPSGPRRGDPSPAAQVQYCPYFALSPISPLPRRLRRAWPACTGRDSGLATHWR